MKKIISLILALMMFSTVVYAGGGDDELDLFDDIYIEDSEEIYEEVYEEEIFYEEPEFFDPYESIDEYDKNLISISDISYMEYDRYTVNHNDRVAICNSPVTIEAKKDLKIFCVIPILELDGEFIPDDQSANIAYEDTGWVYDNKYDGYIIPTKKGKTITITEPGLYNVFAEVDYMGDWTEIVIEVVSPDATYDAKYTASKVMVDGKEVKFEAYNINDNNYFKLRDIAKVLSGTPKQFEVEWDAQNSRINLISGAPYTAVGGELSTGDGTSKVATNGTSNILKDYMTVNLKAYLINGNNYFKLRDLGKLFDFDVSWDGTNNCIIINSQNSYTED